MNNRINSLSWIALLLLLITGACSDDPPLPDNLANFESAAVGLAGAETEIKITLSRTVKTDVPVTVSMVPTKAVYGTHFTTEPEAVADKITLTIPAGSTEASFKVKLGSVLPYGDETINFTIDAATEPVLLGETTALTFSFTAITSEGSELQLNGLIAAEAGSSAGNSVFVYLSNNQQTPVARNTWDLGFYNGEDFRVIINNVNGASVVAVNKTDLALVTSADVNPDDLKVGQGLGNFTIVDDVYGDLSKTAIKQISVAESENKVYVVNRTGGSGNVGAIADLVKVRIVRSGGGYTLQYAKINETTIKTLAVTKDANFNFNYVSFDNNAVSFEPVKSKWDIQWTWGVYWTALGGPPIPYSFSDLVLINYVNGVTAAEVLHSSGVTYDAFAEANLAAITLKGERNVIGSNWRSTSPATGARTDRFYVIKDSGGNIYKLKFITMGSNDGGTRGKPVIQYKLVKKAG